MIKTIRASISLCLLSCILSFSALAKLSAEEEKAIKIILDSKAEPRDAFEALRHFAHFKRDQIETPDGRSIIVAVVRRCGFEKDDGTSIARATLYQLVGTKRAVELIKDAETIDKNFIADVGHAVQGWNMPDDFGKSLKSPDMSIRKRAFESLVKSAEADPKHLASIDERLKMPLIKYIEEFDLFEPSMRMSSLRLLEQLGPAHLDALPVAVRAVAGEDKEARKFALALPILGADADTRLNIVTTLAISLTDSDREISNAAVQLISKAKPDEANPIIATHIIFEISRSGDLNHLELTKRFKIEPRMIAQRVELALANENGNRTALLTSLRLVGAQSQLDDMTQLRNLVFELLASEDAKESNGATAIVTTPRTRAAAEAFIVERIYKGMRVADTALGDLKFLNTETFGKRLIDALRSSRVEIRRAAAETLATTGAKGDTVNAAIAPLVRDRDQATRHAAGKILNTPESLARAQLPDLIEELRSQALSRRQLAARRIDDLGIEPKELTSALVHAVESGDFAARIGLASALENANFSGINSLDQLAQTANGDAKDSSQTYARAALREIGRIKAANQAKP